LPATNKEKPADPVAIAISRLVRLHPEHEWHGTVSDLMTLLECNTDLVNLRTWPEQPNMFSKRLKRLIPQLKAAGISIEWERKYGNRYVHNLSLKGEVTCKT